MKTISLLAVLATASLGFGSHQTPSQSSKSFAIFFYETPAGFASRANANASSYWAKWTGYIGAVQSSGAMESGSALLPPDVSAEIDSHGQRKVNTHGVRLSGFIVVKAESVGEAAAIAKNSPAISDGGRVEVRELLPMSQHKGNN